MGLMIKQQSPFIAYQGVIQTNPEIDTLFQNGLGFVKRIPIVPCLNSPFDFSGSEFVAKAIITIL